LIATNSISIISSSEEKVASNFLDLYNISAGEQKYRFNANVTREELVTDGYEIITINDTYIEEYPALSRAFQDGYSMIYSEDRKSMFRFQNVILEYEDNFYHVLIGYA
jgi:hypothetical protein